MRVEVQKRRMTMMKKLKQTTLQQPRLEVNSYCV
jgi:hypothetical protein